MKIKGYYLDGKSSKRHEASLELNSHKGIKLYLYGPSAEHIGHELIMFDPSSIKIESRIANTAREIILEQEQLFISYDNAGIDALAAKLSPKHLKGTLLHKLESNLSTILVATCAIIALMYISVVYGIPRLTHAIVYNLPDVVEEQFSQSLIILDHSFLEPSKLAQNQQDELRRLMAPHYQDFDNLNINIEFRSGFGANAFALPGGTIVFTDEFIKLAKHNDEIIAVLFHEIGHLKNRHILRRAIQASIMSAFILMVTGDLDTLDIITGLPSLLADLTYSREFETEADQFALEQMRKAGIGIDHFAVIMGRLTDSNTSASEQEHDGSYFSNLKHYLSTHPEPKQRIQRILDYKEELDFIN